MSGMDLDPKSDQIRDVFAHFGLALYQAQCLEKQIVILLSGPHAPTPDKMTRGRHDDLLDTNLDQTFGALVKEVKSRTVLPNDIDEKLELAVKDRNWLAHHYWWDRASEFNTHSGREKMLMELRELAASFSELDAFFVKVVEEWAVNRGLTQEVFAVSLAELLSEPTPPRKKRRRLNRKETLINVFSHTIDEGASLLFELDDHTLWALCDCGLTYGPEEVDFTLMRPIAIFRKALPAVINPRPKGAKNWDYRIQLSTGFYVKVSPLEREGKFTFKCGLHPQALDYTI